MLTNGNTGTYKALVWSAQEQKYVPNPEIGLNIEVHVRGSHSRLLGL